jgi:hypothetical protein
MAKDKPATPAKAEGGSREDRLAAELRANLQRRKGQARARTPGEGRPQDGRPDAGREPGKD